MKLNIEPAGKIVEINGEQAPLWHGTTERGNQIRFVIVAVTEPNSVATTQLLKTVPMHGLQLADEPPVELLAMLGEPAPATLPPMAAPVPATPLPSPRHAPTAAPVARRKSSKRPAQRIATPVAPRLPRQHSAPKPQGPARPLAPKSEATSTPPVATGPVNDALLARLAKAVALLDGRGRGDAHDKHQARQLLMTHRDKMHLVDGADKYAQRPADDENLLD